MRAARLARVCVSHRTNFLASASWVPVLCVPIICSLFLLYGGDYVPRHAYVNYFPPTFASTSCKTATKCFFFSSQGQMPLASSRVVAPDPEVPVAGAKDGWVEVVVHEVSTR